MPTLDGALVCRIHGGDRQGRPIDHCRFEPVGPSRRLFAMAGESSAAASGSGEGFGNDEVDGGDFVVAVDAEIG